MRARKCVRVDGIVYNACDSRRHHRKKKTRKLTRLMPVSKEKNDRHGDARGNAFASTASPLPAVHIQSVNLAADTNDDDTSSCQFLESKKRIDAGRVGVYSVAMPADSTRYLRRAHVSCRKKENDRHVDAKETRWRQRAYTNACR